MKIVCPPVYHLNGIVATHTLGHMGHMTGRAHCFHDCIYIYIYIIYICIYIYIYIYICLYMYTYKLSLFTALLDNDVDVAFASFTYF